MIPELKFSVAVGSARKLRIFTEDLNRVARPLARLGTFFKRLFAVPLAGCDGFAPFSFPYAGKEIMEKIAKCYCRHCNQGIEFEESDLTKGEIRMIGCPHCNLETEIFLPQKGRQPLFPTFSKIKLPKIRPIKLKGIPRQILYVLGAMTVVIAVHLLASQYQGSQFLKGLDELSQGGVGFLFIATIVLFFYFLPTIIAGAKKRRNTAAICILNVFLGWTFLGWLAALIWAVTEDKKE